MDKTKALDKPIARKHIIWIVICALLPIFVPIYYNTQDKLRKTVLSIEKEALKNTIGIVNLTKEDVKIGERITKVEKAFSSFSEKQNTNHLEIIKLIGDLKLAIQNKQNRE